jgi:hypothetical protein
MKKYLIILIMLISMSTFAGDQNIDFGVRSDWKLKNNDIDKTGIPNSSSFEVNYLLAAFSGKIGSTYHYFISTDLLQSNSTPDVVNKMPAFIDEAYLTKNVVEGLAFNIGKKAVLIGGREFDYYPYDLYSSSYYLLAKPSNEVGITVTKDVGEQLWMFQYFNGNKENGIHGSNTQSKFGYSIGWYGNLFDKFLKPIVAYAVVPKGVEGAGLGLRHSRGNDVYLGGGVQLNTPHNFIVETDYGMLTQNHFGGDGIHQITKSFVGLIRYTGENYLPFFKLMSDSITLDSAEIKKRSAFDVGIEYKAEKDDLVCYHFVYTGESIKSAVDSSPTTITVGLKFDASLLK